MIQKVIKIGDRIELKRLAAVARDKLDHEAKLYNSQLLEMVDDTHINISVPIDSGHLIPLEVGGRFEARFITANGVYMCKVEIKERFKRDHIYYLGLKMVSDLTKDQRRQYFRLEKIRPMEYHKLLEEEKKILIMLATNKFESDVERRNLLIRLKTIEPVQVEATTVNISGGGLKFNSPETLVKGDFIRISLLLDDSDATALDLFAKVIFSTSVPNKSLMYEHRVEFINMAREVREKIVKYVFVEERKLRHKDNGI
ncbi:MAG: flagellar brake protein [Lachnospiraceae bacterium]|nr:flagellar brake protein [Lachnospiraceae bacterium]